METRYGYRYRDDHRHWLTLGGSTVNRRRFHYQFNHPLKYGPIDNPF